MSNLKKYRKYLEETIDDRLSLENKEKLLKINNLLDKKSINDEMIIRSAYILRYINPDMDLEDFTLANSLIKTCILFTISDLIENEDLILIDKGDKKNE